MRQQADGSEVKGRMGRVGEWESGRIVGKNDIRAIEGKGGRKMEKIKCVMYYASKPLVILMTMVVLAGLPETDVIAKEAAINTKETISIAREPVAGSKETDVSAQEDGVCAKETYVSARENGVGTKGTGVSTQESADGTKRTGGIVEKGALGLKQTTVTKGLSEGPSGSGDLPVLETEMINNNGRTKAVISAKDPDGVVLIQIDNDCVGIRKTIYESDFTTGKGLKHKIIMDFPLTANGRYNIYAYDSAGNANSCILNVRDIERKDISVYIRKARFNQKDIHTLQASA